MAVLEYRCMDCSSLFEHLSGVPVSCINCTGENCKRATEGVYAPNKLFCPHGKSRIDAYDDLAGSLNDLVVDNEHSCGGCTGGGCSTKPGVNKKTVSTCGSANFGLKSL